jgi:hypothetical protein
VGGRRRQGQLVCHRVTAVAAFTETTSETLTMQTGQPCWNCKTLFAYGSGKGCCNRRFCHTCALRACRMQSRTALHTCRHVQCKQRLPVTSRVRASRGANGSTSVACKSKALPGSKNAIPWAVRPSHARCQWQRLWPRLSKRAALPSRRGDCMTVGAGKEGGGLRASAAWERRIQIVSHRNVSH